MRPQPGGRDALRWRRTSRERPRDGAFDWIGVLRIPKHLAAVHDDRESLADLVTEAQPHPPRRIESDDLDPHPVSEVPEQVFRDPVRSIRILDHESRGLVPFFLSHRLDVPVREGLGTGGAPRFQDRGEQPEELEPLGACQPDSVKGEPSQVASRAFGAITYEFTGARGRTSLHAFVLFYLIIISAAFIALIASFWNAFRSTFIATIGILFAGLLCGQLLYRVKMNVFAVTGIGLVLVVASIYLGVLFPLPSAASWPFGVWNLPFWAFIAAIILYLAAILPTPTFIQPTNYLAFYPAYAAIILILVGALATPFTLGSSPPVPIQLDMGPFLTDPQGILGPIWPILFVAIACGAISGWHSLVSSSSSSSMPSPSRRSSLGSSASSQPRPGVRVGSECSGTSTLPPSSASGCRGCSRFRAAGGPCGCTSAARISFSPGSQSC